MFTRSIHARVLIQRVVASGNISNPFVNRVWATGSSKAYHVHRPNQLLSTDAARTCRATFFRAYSSTQDTVHPTDVGDLVRSNRVVVFMKGNPEEPRCGFSNAVCRVLEMHGVLDKAKSGKHPNLFASYDILEREDLRSAAKTYADWPTFPQVYFDGEFVGGCDILLEMHRSGKLTEELERLGIGSALHEKTSGI